MANPRQRRKARSSSHRPVSHARNAKRNLKKTPPIRGPAILSERWDKRKTVRQNYAALGLIHTLNPSASGGVEPTETTEAPPVNPTAASTSSQPNPVPPIPKGHGRIVRDEDGNILRIELAEEDEEMPEIDDRDKDMEELAPEVEPQLHSKWVTGLGGGKKAKGVVEELERIASSTHNTSTTLSAPISGAGPRHASGGEVAYLKRLVDKYGTDVEQMARDRKLNAEQRTVGQLTRSLKRCGFEARS
ncbi:ribosome biogenesis protein Nop16 [Mycena albidolilacea]|uniref:Nucleolar protein 16 n=1 Tax=Mycena albidolilacea TaxID=1033008 RepID=A0AAD7A546_9AGAR|nr:ribosome biogenesis protein Nop16 [Mycena albidolilacea]